MSLTFPIPSGPGDSFLASNGYTYRWDGYKWNVVVGGVTSLLSLYATQEAVAVLNSSTNVVEHDCRVRNIFYHNSLTGNITANLTNFTLTNYYATTVTIVLDQGAQEYSLEEVRINGTTSTVYWVGGLPPLGTPAAKDIISLSIVNNTGTYVVFGQQITFE